MKAKKDTIVADTKSSEPEKVSAFLKKLKHPLTKEAQVLRKIILGSSKDIGEEIFWNAPAFFYTGKMKPFKPKEYKRYIVVFNFFKKECIRLIFLRGALAGDKSGLLEGDYADGRRLALFYDLKSIKSSEKTLQKAVKQLVKIIDK